MARIMIEFADEVLDAVRDTKGIDVEDVRARMVDPIRHRVHDPSATKDTRPTGDKRQKVSVRT